MTLIDRATALTALKCLDLTSLKADEPPHEIQELIERAATIHGPVAAVCLYAKHLDQPYFSLPDARIKIATVVNFPLGTQSPDQVAQETTDAITKGVQEIDLVLPYQDLSQAPAVIRACRTAAGSSVLKVILETGALVDEASIDRASRIALDQGADFLKTSTGKTTVSATLAATDIMLKAIRSSGRTVGLKPSGGIKTLTDAAPFIQQAQQALGALTPDNFRLGASSLLTDVLIALRKNEGA